MRNYFYYDKLDSTMSEYHRLKEMNPAPLAVCAKTQNDGIGRGNHVWISPEGGLWFTFDIVGDKSMASFALYAGFCMHHTLETLFQPLVGRLQIKWTNDIICDERKLGGILCRYQQSKQIYTIGMGINTNNEIDPNLVKFGAISLKEALGFPVSNRSLWHCIIHAIEGHCWEISDELSYLTYCNDNLFGRGRWALLETGGLNLKAEIMGIDSSGALLIRKEMGEYISMHTGSIIEFLD